MRTPSIPLLCALALVVFAGSAVGQTPYYDQTTEGHLVFHPIKTDPSGAIVPWYSTDRGSAYDFAILAVWRFWHRMRTDLNGLPYYMNHQVWRPRNDPRGLGGDQLAMALSSWQLLYQYTGDEEVKENMKFIADYYLAHSLSPPDAVWPSIPYPYNTLIYSGYYDGDMVIGVHFTQPDKAGSFGCELVKLYKMTGNQRYLDASVKIANTLAMHTKTGDADRSPLPFKVNALTGEVGVLKSNRGDGSTTDLSGYTSNWSGTLELWEMLDSLGEGSIGAYRKASGLVIDWIKKYPLQNNKWGPFFEDIPGWSDTQINAVTMARYIMLHPGLFPEWETEVREILDWVYERLGNREWAAYGVLAVNEQTAYMTPGNSHTSRQAAAELQYARLSGDRTRVETALRQLDWATYMVDHDGKNCYPRDEVWLTDGYGDYVRHYLRAMAEMPGIAPSGQDHILHSTSILSQADYRPNFNKKLALDVRPEELGTVRIFYRTFDNRSTEIIRMAVRPGKVLLNNRELAERMDTGAEGWSWEPLDIGGILRIRHETGNSIKIFDP